MNKKSISYTYIMYIIIILLMFSPIIFICCGVFYSVVNHKDIVTNESVSVNEVSRNEVVLVDKVFEVFDLASLDNEVLLTDVDGDEMHIIVKLNVEKLETISLSVRGYSPADITVSRVRPEDLSIESSSDGVTFLSFPIMDWVEINVGRTYYLVLER